jgi:hypothetical protein
VFKTKKSQTSLVGQDLEHVAFISPNTSPSRPNTYYTKVIEKEVSKVADSLASTGDFTLESYTNSMLELGYCDNDDEQLMALA